MSEILKTKDLSRHFGGVAALNLVSLCINDKQLMSIIGPNGAGKTTLINVITGRLPATSGRVFYQGKDITRRPVHDRVRLGICRTFQINSIFLGSTVFENLRIARQARLGGSLKVFSRRQSLRRVTEDTTALLERLGLTAVAHQPASNLAYGDQRLLEVGIALASEPRVLLLDEPTAGMSPGETEQISRLIRELANEVAVVLVEHDMELVMSISDCLTVLHQGGVIAEGTPEEISENQQVRQAYLGSGKWAPLLSMERPGASDKEGCKC